MDYFSKICNVLKENDKENVIIKILDNRIEDLSYICLHDCKYILSHDKLYKLSEIIENKIKDKDLKKIFRYYEDIINHRDYIVEEAYYRYGFIDGVRTLLNFYKNSKNY